MKKKESISNFVIFIAALLPVLPGLLLKTILLFLISNERVFFTPSI